MTVGELLTEWLGADHGWRPSTLVGYRSAAGYLARDVIGSLRVSKLSPEVVHSACQEWRAMGWQDPTVWARVRLFRSAVGWAHQLRMIEVNPLDGMRHPPHPGGRMHASVEQVKAILECGSRGVELALSDPDPSAAGEAWLHRAEQVLLLAQLAANSGARRGELASLKLGDLDGDILAISRSTSSEVLGPTKSGRVRRLTLGRETASLWRSMVELWRQRSGAERFGPWLFSAGPEHSVRLKTDTVGHWFAPPPTAEAGHPDVTLHRLRHSVATNLVSQGDFLRAQYRLGHADLSTTLQIYSHATPLADADAAESLERLYRR